MGDGSVPPFFTSGKFALSGAKKLNNAHKSPWWGILMMLLIATDLLGFRFCHHNKHFEGASCSLPPF